jgi:hypothetical protein
MVWTGDANNRLAKSLIKLIDQIDHDFPSRDRRNDGTIGDEAHQQRDSDHNPQIRDGSMGVVTALDVTHDPAAGFDARVFADSLRAAKDARIKYVIFNGKIFSSTVSPWTWRDRDKGPGDHSEHVHISVVADRARFDDEGRWPFDLSGAVPGQADVSRPKLKLGDSGPAVIDLQHLLGIGADGVFGSETEQAVRAFQASRNLVVDGIVGSHTWGALTASPGMVAEAGQVRGLSPATIEQIVKLAADSDLARFKWGDRGIAPRGYIKGMAVTFGQVYAKWLAGDSAARLMAAMNSRNDDVDALSWFDSKFRAAGMDNAAAGAATLRHLFVLLIGLGMRASGGRYSEGRDTSVDNATADTATAGLFQMSWNARVASPELPRLFAAYSAKLDGFVSIFQEGVTPKESDRENVGTGEGVAFQRLCKSCPAFAVEAAGVGLRVIRKHWGPINRHEVDIRQEADSLLQQVQRVIDSTAIVPDFPLPVPLPSRIPPLAGNPLLLLVLVLMMLSKEKPMADDPAKPGQGIDLVPVLLPLLLQSMESGKQIDITQLLSMLLIHRPVASATPAPTPALATPQPTDLNSLLLPLLFQALTSKQSPGAPPPAPEQPADTTPMIQKPSVQLSVAGLGLSTILQALGFVGTPFGMGQVPTQAGTLATLVPIATAAFGATGGFGALQGMGRSLLGGLFGKSK